MKILVTDSGSVKSQNDLSLDILKQFGTVCEYSGITRQELLEEVRDTDILLCNKTVIDKEIMSQSNNLKYIGLFATGYNNIDIDFARQKGIVVCNAGSYSTNAVAQQVFAYILNHYTKVPQYDAFVKGGGWQNATVFSPLVFATDELYQKTIGLIGYGSIAKAVEKIALAFGMKVLVHTRTVRENDPKFVPLDYLLENSDIVSVHCPLNEQSANMFGIDAFNKFKDGAFFVNTARGGVVVEADLLKALESGKLSGAAVDVLTEEPMSKSCVLMNAPNITITPHTCWAPLTTRKRLLNIVCDNITAFLNGNPQNNVAK
jgi:glycerate dehydrogenase